MRVQSLYMVAASATLLYAMPAQAENSIQQDTTPSPASKSVEVKTKDTSSKVTSTAPVADEQTAPAQASPPQVKKSQPAPVVPKLKATINLSSQTLTVTYAGQTKGVWKISSGRGGYRTPTGTYRPQWMSKMHYSKKYDNAPMPHSVFFHKGYAIHATYATRRLGAPASHGCIRLSPANAKKFYYLVQKYGKSNTRISIHGVAVDRRVYAKRKKKKRVKYASSYSWNAWNAPTAYKAPKKRRKRRTARTYTKPYKKAKKTYTVGYAKQAYTWPGD